MEPAQYIAIGLVVLAGSALQSAAGFGFGLFAIPVLLLVGLEPYEAIPIVAVAALTQMLTGVWHHRRDVPWRLIAWMAPVGIAALPLGIWILGQMTALDRGTVRQIFGVILLVTLAIQWWLRPEPRERLHPAWGAAAAGLAGVFSGMAGMPGPPVVIWVMAHKWSGQKSRALIWALLGTMIPFNLILLAGRFGQPAIHGMALGLLFLPAVFLGAAPGLWLGNRLPKPALRRIALAILLLIGVYSLAQPGLSSDTPPPTADHKTAGPANTKTTNNEAEPQKVNAQKSNEPKTAPAESDEPPQLH